VTLGFQRNSLNPEQALLIKANEVAEGDVKELLGA
jgi:hypothetical protein